MTLLEKINKLTWFNEINKLKDILKELLSRDSRPYKVYTALLTQIGTDAPIAEVLENTLGDIVWSYYAEGQYKAQLIGKLLLNKRVILVSPTNTADGTTNGYSVFSDEDISNDSFIVKFISITGEPLNGLVQPRGIEIKVYN